MLYPQSDYPTKLLTSSTDTHWYICSISIRFTQIDVRRYQRIIYYTEVSAEEAKTKHSERANMHEMNTLILLVTRGRRDEGLLA